MELESFSEFACGTIRHYIESGALRSARNGDRVMLPDPLRRRVIAAIDQHLEQMLIERLCEMENDERGDAAMQRYAAWWKHSQQMKEYRAKAIAEISKTVWRMADEPNGISFALH